PRCLVLSTRELERSLEVLDKTDLVLNEDHPRQHEQQDRGCEDRCSSGSHLTPFSRAAQNARDERSSADIQTVVVAKQKRDDGQRGKQDRSSRRHLPRRGDERPTGDGVEQKLGIAERAWIEANLQ